MADTSQPDLADTEEGGKKRKRLMMLIAFAGVSALSLSTAGIVVATSSVSSSPASVEAEAAAAAPPEIVPGSLGDEDADQIATPSAETDLPTEIDAVENDPVDEPLWPIGPLMRLPDLRPSTPTAPAPSVIPDATQPEPSPLQPAPAEPTQNPSPTLPATPTASPSATPQPEPTVGGGVGTPGTGAGHGDEEGGDPSTPHPGDTSEEGGAGTSPDPTESPTSEDEPSTGGGDEVNAQQLSIAIQHEAYHLLMHVKGVFDLEGATWRIAAGDLPEGLTIDPATGTISGRTLAEPGRYVFQLEVANSQRAIRGWFLMVVAKPITPAPEPGDDSTANPDPGQGNGSGEDGGSVPTNPSEPDAPDAGGETPGPGADPDAPANPDTPGTGTDPVVPGGGTGQVDPGDAASPTPTAPATEGPAQPASPSPTPTPSASGNETPSEPVDGEGSEVGPADPEIDQGAGGIQIDKIEFSLSPRISFTVGSEIDLDLGATSSTGLAIAYVAEGLPSWLNIVDGHLRGTAPSTTGSFNLTVTAKNEKGSIAQRSAVYVLPAHIEMDTAPLQMVSGQGRSLPLRASNGASNADFVYTLISAQGATATIDESTLTASYALPGTYELVIEAQDVNSPQIGRNTFRIPVVVDVVPLTISVADIDTTQYVTMLERFTAAGGWGGYQFRVVEGSLPAGLSLKWDGTLSGAPRDTDTRSVTIEVVDNKGLTARGVVTITVKGNPAITPAGSLTTAVGPYSAIFSTDSSQLYLATNQTISLVDIATSTTIKQLKIGTNRSAALSPDGNRYAVAADGALQVYDAKTLEKVNEIKVGTSAMAVVWSADSNTLHFARSKSGSVAELVSYDASTGAVLGSVAFGKTGSGWRIETIADGRVLATASGSSGIYVLDTLSGATRVITPTLTSYFVAAAPGNTAWTGAGGTLRRVDLETGDVLATHSLTGIVLAGLTMSPDGRWLYVSDSRNLIAVDTRDGSEVVRVPLPSGMSPRTTVSPDGRMVAVTGGPNTTTLLKFTASD